MAVDVALRFEVEDLYTAYAEALDGGDFERWPGFFTEDAWYEVIPRENHERGLPLATIRCESRAMIEDRVTAIRETLMFEPRYMRHILSGFRIGPEEGDVLPVTASYLVLETLPDEATRVFNAGRYLDRLVREDGALRFREKRCVFDSCLVPNSLIFPI